jgi:hypothetical protein
MTVNIYIFVLVDVNPPNITSWQRGPRIWTFTTNQEEDKAEYAEDVVTIGFIFFFIWNDPLFLNSPINKKHIRRPRKQTINLMFPVLQDVPYKS